MNEAGGIGMEVRRERGSGSRFAADGRWESRVGKGREVVKA